jgi:UDP-N-acetylglucosamine diphosphorylase/glucosamine-1-phosphate N-acetyltransferase
MAQSAVKAVIFDDGGGRLGPLTDLRAAFEARTGAMTTLDRLRHELGQWGVEIAGVWAPESLAPLVRERVDLPCNDDASIKRGAAEVLIVSGRSVRVPEEARRLKLGSALHAPGADRQTRGVLVAARLSADDALALLHGRRGPESFDSHVAAGAMALERPWDIIRFRDRVLDYDLAALAEGLRPAHTPAGVTFIGDQITIAPGARLSPGVILDAESGPIVIDENAIVRPGAIICGPAYIGKHSTVLERAHIKAHTAIGPVCKVGGEIGGTIFQGFANKAHEGHLGDSWVGEWANLGAGTTNSNLLNTYGEVTATAAPGMSRERTGLNFLGAIIGDHVKTAIMTRIMTGSVFGTGAMIAHPTPGNLVQAFEWLTAERRQQFRFEKFMDVAGAMMSRRKISPSEQYTARLKALHAACAGESS